MKSPRVSLAALMGAQAQVTFNDNAAKLMLVALAQFPGVLGDIDINVVRSLLGALLVAPFVAFSPLAGWMNDRFAKSRVLNLSLALQFFVMLGLVGALWQKSLWGAVVCFFLLAVQATVFSPAKRGILREMVGSEDLSHWVGIMEMLSVSAILAGGFGGGRMFDHWTRFHHSPWQGALVTAVVLTALSGFSWLLFQLVNDTKPQSTEPFAVSLFWRHGSQLKELWEAKPLLRATWGIVFFYGIGGYLYLLLMQMGADAHGGGNVGSASESGLMLLLLGVGTVIGNLSAGLLSKRGIDLGLAPVGGALLVIALFTLGVIGEVERSFFFWLVATGFASGFFLVPLYAYLQEMAGSHRRGRILAAVGLMDSSGGLVANGLFAVMASDRMLDWEPRTQLFAMTGLTVLMLIYSLWQLPHQTLCTVMRLIGPLFYRVRSRGGQFLPASGGGLIVCNHLSYVDAVVLQIASPRPLRFVAFAGFARSPTVRFLFRALGVIPVAPDKPMKGIRTAIDAIKEGELVCVFPEGAISRTGQLMYFSVASRPLPGQPTRRSIPRSSMGCGARCFPSPATSTFGSRRVSCRRMSSCCSVGQFPRPRLTLPPPAGRCSTWVRRLSRKDRSSGAISPASVSAHWRSGLGTSKSSTAPPRAGRSAPPNSWPPPPPSPVVCGPRCRRSGSASCCLPGLVRQSPIWPSPAPVRPP